MKQLITILGPTASGKTQLGAYLAAEINGEIISADSRQIYRKMDIGTGKDISDYTVNGKLVPFHLVDIQEPGFRYNVFAFLNDFSTAFNNICDANNVPILCGGSGMYLDAVLRGYDMSKVPNNPELRANLENFNHSKLVEMLRTFGPLHNNSDITDNERLIRAIEIAEYQKIHPESTIKLPEFSSVVFGISFERKLIRERITQRLTARLNEGMIHEVEELLNDGIQPEQLIYYGLEYKFVTMYVIGQISYETMFEKLNIAIHQFAKRQMTWYRRMEKKGVKIDWIDGAQSIKSKVNHIKEILQQ